MIGTIDIRINAQYPNIPINPVFQFVGSPSTFIIQDLPKQIGDWHITSIYIQAEYPDNTIKTATCETVKGSYIGTVQSSSVSGSSSNGLTVFADGIDEKDNPVTGYVLGKADIYVLNCDSTITPGTTSYQVRFYPTQPSEPHIGDTYIDNGSLMIWNGTSWVSTGTTITKVSQLENDANYQNATQVQNVINNAGFLKSLNYGFEEINENDNQVYDNTINTVFRKKYARMQPYGFDLQGLDTDPTGYGLSQVYSDSSDLIGFAAGVWYYLISRDEGETWEEMDSVSGTEAERHIVFEISNLSFDIYSDLAFQDVILPDFKEGKARDFLLYIDTNCDTVSITFPDTDHDENWQHTYPITYLSDDDEVFEFESGKTIMAFSEISPHTFLVNKQKLNVVTQSQGD